MYEITKIFNIACSHRLYDNEVSDEENKQIFGKCFNLPSHGHNYKIEVTLRNQELAHGMVTNFTNIKIAFKKYIDEVYDHHFLNDLMDDIPTAENMAKKFYQILKKEFEDLYSIKIWETDTSSAKYWEDK